ncbi:MAG: WD40 repeat domain-containing protein [Gemmataceae bacterium]
MAELRPGKATLMWELPFEGAGIWPTSVAFLGNRRVAAGNQAGQIFVWELPESPSKELPPPVRRLDGHTNGITRLVATADGKTLASSSLDHTVRIWDLTAAPSSTAEVILDSQTREREAKRGKKDVLTQPGVPVAVQTACQVLAGHQDWVNGLGMSRDQKRLISGDDSGLVIVWDLASLKEVSRWTCSKIAWVTAAALSPDGKLAFVSEYCHRRGDFDRPPPQARLWNVDSGAEKLDLLQVWLPNVKVRDNSYGYAQAWGKFVKGGLIAADFSPDGKLLALGQGGETDTGKVLLVDVASGKVLREVSGHRYGVTDVVFSADGKYVLSTGRDTTVRICQVADGKEVGQAGQPRGGQFKDWLHALALSPDHQWLAAADIAGAVAVWKFEG